MSIENKENKQEIEVKDWSSEAEDWRNDRDWESSINGSEYQPLEFGVSRPLFSLVEFGESHNVGFTTI